MNNLITLGPKDTFSDMAARKYSSQTGGTIKYEKTIASVFDAVANGDCVGVVPIENLTEGFVQPVLDSLISHNLFIIKELLLAVQFSFVGNGDSISSIKRLFVHPVAAGQCSEFIGSIANCEIIYTNSNIDSLNRLENGDVGTGAIVPIHIFDNISHHPLTVENVSNYEYNMTRFVVISKEKLTFTTNIKTKSSIIVRDDADHSGVLSVIAEAFAKRDINMTSILSIPTKKAMGKYCFYIELVATNKSDELRLAYNDIRESFPVQEIGIYEKSY